MARLSPLLTNGQLDRQIRMTDKHELVEMILYREYMVFFKGSQDLSRYHLLIVRIMRSRLNKRKYIKTQLHCFDYHSR